MRQFLECDLEAAKKCLDEAAVIPHPINLTHWWAERFAAYREKIEAAAKAREAEMREALKKIARMDYSRAATNGAAYDAIHIARNLLSHESAEPANMSLETDS